MDRKEVNAKSPIRVLEGCLHGGLGRGNLGVVMSRAGVGKTAFLVQLGLDDLLRGKKVLHVALGQRLEHVQSWYDALFADLASYTELSDRSAVATQVAALRLIQTFADGGITPERIEQTLQRNQTHLAFSPAAILVDGFDWTAPEDEVREALVAMKALAAQRGAELWISAQTHRSQERPQAILPPLDRYAALVDVAVFLEPAGDAVAIRVLKDHGHKLSEPHLVLHADTLRITAEGEGSAPRSLGLPPAAYTLLSGGADGAESAFGREAERYGLHEINFTFEGRTPPRARGLTVLDETELRQGEVSEAYLVAQMHRTYPSTPQFRKMLQTLWHQVSSAGEVFVVGTLNPDGTVKGGTGWAAELAKHWGRRVFVFDQGRKSWFTWRNGDWGSVEAPMITKTRFAGTGTRALSEAGDAAIRALFERSFART